MKTHLEEGDEELTLLLPFCIIGDVGWLSIFTRNHLSHSSRFFMALQTEAQWKLFFQGARINDYLSTTYAKTFVDNGFSELSLSQLDKDTLIELGITTIGHRLSILQCAKGRGATPTTAPSAPVAKASVTAKLTTITHEMTTQQFRKLQQDWAVYKQITHLQPEQATSHLYNACDETV